MTDVISYSKVVEHGQLGERLRGLRSAATAARTEAPDLPAGPVLVTHTARLLRDIYRLVSREPGARALTRLDPHQPVTPRQLAVMLRDGQLALDATVNPQALRRAALALVPSALALASARALALKPPRRRCITRPCAVSPSPSSSSLSPPPCPPRP